MSVDQEQSITATLEIIGEPPPSTVDQELGAMAAIVDALGSLDDGARERVMRWANDRFYRSVLNEGKT